MKNKNFLWRIRKKVKEVGLGNALIGCIKRVKYMWLIRKYHFAAWHLSPYEWKKYAQECVHYVNKHGCKTIVDIGCGLGEILLHVNATKKIGLDLDEGAIMAARELCGKTIIFEKGSFSDLIQNSIDYCITLNFMHGGLESEWKKVYHLMAERNDIKHFIVDTVPDKAFSSATKFLNWSEILPDNYKRVEHLGPFLSGRYLEVWEKK